MAQEKLEHLCRKFLVCPKFCSLPKKVGQCYHHSITGCEGIRKHSESVLDYNQKVSAAVASLKEDSSSFVIREKNRYFRVEAFVLVRQGVYQGFGFNDSQTQVCVARDYEPFLKRHPVTYRTHKILSNYLRKQGAPKLLFLRKSRKNI